MSFSDDLKTLADVQRNLETMKIFYGASAEGNIDAFKATMDKDIVVTEADCLPYAGVFKGRSSLRGLAEKLSAYFGEYKVVVNCMTAGGDWVVTLLDIIPAKTGEPIAIAESARLKDGKIVEIKPYYFDVDQVKRFPSG